MGQFLYTEAHQVFDEKLSQNDPNPYFEMHSSHSLSSQFWFLYQILSL